MANLSGFGKARGEAKTGTYPFSLRVVPAMGLTDDEFNIIRQNLKAVDKMRFLLWADKVQSLLATLPLTRDFGKKSRKKTVTESTSTTTTDGEQPQTVTP